MFDRFRTEPTTEELEPEDNKVSEEEDEEDLPMALLVIDGENTFEYTEHEAVAHFSNGESKTFTFDIMDHKSNSIVLGNYTDETSTFRGALEPAGREKFATISKENLNYFETTNRTKRELSEEYHEEYEMDVKKAATKAHGRDDAHIEKIEEEHQD